MEESARVASKMKHVKKISFLAISLSIIAIAGEVFIMASQKPENADVEYKKALQDSYRILSPVLPSKLSFAGEEVPMDTYYVNEALDREVLTNMYWQSNTVMMMKRAYRWFPVIEPILERNGVPQDFKYLCVIESGLMNVTSSAKAQGYWQFIKTTGTAYGLEINDEVDERNDMEKSTQAACRFLKKLYAQFGSWTAAAAAYNCGEAGLQRRMTEQGINNYYHLALNAETGRYVYRILALKLIMQRPQDYGFNLRKKDMYPKIPYKTITVSNPNINLYNLAKENSTTYKNLKLLNPWLISNRLTNKAMNPYVIKIPTDVGESLQKIKSTEDMSTAWVTCL